MISTHREWPARQRCRDSTPVNYRAIIPWSSILSWSNRGRHITAHSQSAPEVSGEGLLSHESGDALVAAFGGTGHMQFAQRPMCPRLFEERKRPRSDTKSAACYLSSFNSRFKTISILATKWSEMYSSLSYEMPPSASLTLHHLLRSYFIICSFIFSNR